ncbi:hypothetical protein [uncultured Rothia sp.]|uniref:hypothetical protein n=1 Tax=uncultured Rothia sp. TaxID=316088 RepID=UPI0026081EB0|nr:hypothetical protein [uncultured Rothia sp.]
MEEKSSSNENIHSSMKAPPPQEQRGIHIEKGLPLDNVDSSMKAHPLVRGEKRKKAMLHPR